MTCTDLVKFTPIDEARYAALDAQAARGEWVPRAEPFDFDLARYERDPIAYAAAVREVFA